MTSREGTMIVGGAHSKPPHFGIPPPSIKGRTVGGGGPEWNLDRRSGCADFGRPDLLVV
jgi:hypothetical protein